MAEERLSNLRIIEQIEEKEEEKSGEAHSSKPVVEDAKIRKGGKGVKVGAK